MRRRGEASGKVEAKQSKAKERESAIWWCTDVGKGEGGRPQRRVGGKGAAFFSAEHVFGTKTRGKWEQEHGRGQDLPDRAIRKALFRRGNQQDHVCSPFSRQRPCSTNTAPLSALLLLFRSSPSSCGRVLLLHRSLNLDPV